MELTEFFTYTKTPATVVHVIAVVFGMGSALVSDVLFSFFAKDKKLNSTELSTLAILKNLVLYGLVLIFFSGIFIFLSDISRYIHSDKFLAKMTILVVLLVNGHILNKYIWHHLLNKNFFTLKNKRGVRRLAFACGAVSVISWLSVCTLGILNSLNMSYALIMSTYLVVALFGIFVALIIEKKELD